MQNTSHAVMAQRFEPKHSADDFPTPPWATRALFKHVLDDEASPRTMSCLEPAWPWPTERPEQSGPLWSVARSTGCRCSARQSPENELIDQRGIARRGCEDHVM